MIAVIDYGVGNLFSLSSSLAYLGLENKITRSAGAGRGVAYHPARGRRVRRRDGKVRVHGLRSPSLSGRRKTASAGNLPWHATLFEKKL